MRLAITTNSIIGDISSPNRLPTPPTDTPPTPQPTQQYTSPLPVALISLARRDRSYEEARIAARKRRRTNTADSSGDGVTGTGTGTSTPGTGPSTPAAAATAPSDRAPDIKPMTKKERDRLAKQGQTEEVLHRAANQTAQMALGGSRKKYSWMTGGGGSGGGASAPRINTAVGGGGAATPGVATVGGAGGAPGKLDEGLRARERRYGDFREDGRGGDGIQLRDLFAVLDADGREKKTRSRWGVRMGAGEQR